MDPELSRILEAASTRAATEFAIDYPGGVYAELEDQSIDPTGLYKIFATAEGARFKEFVGKLEFSSISERDLTFLTRIFKYGVNIPRQKWDQFLAWMDQNLLNLVSGAGANYRAEKDMMHTKLLDRALAGESIKSLYHDSVLLGDIKMPGSGTGQAAVTNQNKISGGKLTANNLRNIVHKVRGHLARYQYPNGLPYFAPDSMAANLRMMYAPTEKMDALINRVFNTGMYTGESTEPRINNVMVKPNNLWLSSDFPELNTGGPNGKSALLFYLPIAAGKLRFFQWVRRTATLEIHTNVPRTQGEADSEFQTDAVIETEMYKWAPRFEAESGPGGPLQVLAVEVEAAQ